MAARGFYDLMRWRTPQYFYAFDLLWKDGQDLRGLPLIKRKRLLKKIVKSPVLFVDHLVGRAVDLFQAVCERDLEGIVAKAAQGLYQPEKTTSDRRVWQRTLRTREGLDFHLREWRGNGYTHDARRRFFGRLEGEVCFWLLPR